MKSVTIFQGEKPVAKIEIYMDDPHDDVHALAFLQEWACTYPGSELNRYYRTHDPLVGALVEGWDDRSLRMIRSILAS